MPYSNPPDIYDSEGKQTRARKRDGPSSGYHRCGSISSPNERGDVAQLVEHLLCKQGVRGSSPRISTKLEALISREKFLRRGDRLAGFMLS